MKALPIGISTLSTIIEEDMVYVDKTGYALALAEKPGRYFFSRPRRFGKSLFVDTLKELFEGNEELFRGLYIHDRWDWSRKFPVIKIDFAGGVIHSKEDLNDKMDAFFFRHEDLYHISLKNRGTANRLNELIEKLLRETGSRVVLLVDEYDKPLLDNIERPEAAAEIREELKSLYSVIKERDADIRFVFLTGVSRFSKVNIFSGINNLNDITLDKRFSTLCGYTQGDLETIFGEHLKGVDRNTLREWYNGYSFLGEAVYNPFDILLFIDKGQVYRNYWFETGTPSFLMKLFKKNRYFLPDLDDLTAGEELLGSFEPGELEPVTLLFQSGYLTIKESFTEGGEFLFRLGYPNTEVKRSLNRQFIAGYTEITQDRVQHERNTYRALQEGDLAGLEHAVRRLFAGIPWRNFRGNDLADSEGYYASVLYAFFSAVNCVIIPEDITNHGQADLTVILDDRVYVTEIKVLGEGEELSKGENPALTQIRERDYARKYLGRDGQSVYEVGMVFSRRERNLVSFNGKERKNGA